MFKDDEIRTAFAEAISLKRGNSEIDSLLRTFRELPKEYQKFVIMKLHNLELSPRDKILFLDYFLKKYNDWKNLPASGPVESGRLINNINPEEQKLQRELENLSARFNAWFESFLEKQRSRQRQSKSNPENQKNGWIM